MKQSQKNSTNEKLSTKIDEKSFTVVAIGASAGGLEAFSLLLKNLPADTGMAFIYVQHLSPSHKSFLTSILSKITTMKVQEIDNMEKMEPNNVYVIPPNKVIEVVNGHIRLLPRIVKSSPTLSIDLLFSTLAATHKENVIGVVLSGYATDGMLGLKAIKDAGGITFAQDDSAQAESMPKSAILAGAVDFILPPDKIAAKIIHLSKSGIPEFSKEESTKNVSTLKNNNYDLDSIFELLLKETGIDFSHYKLPTIKRRINHKMKQSGINSINDYVKLLIEKNSEITILYTDLLINVTSFFREKETFTFIKDNLLASIINGKNADEPLRIWVTACSTGQEAYSFAMLIADFQIENECKIPVQIFATDLSEDAIKIARAGQYSNSEVESVPKKYLQQFFNKVGDTFFIKKEIREMCIFAPHNILNDPPFSRMDFVSCCNLLIYFDASAQKKVFLSLHFALRETGFLMLGKAESAGATSQLFTVIDPKFKIFGRKNNLGVQKILDLKPRFSRINKHSNIAALSSKNPTLIEQNIEVAIDSILLNGYMPACAVVNKDLEIVQFRGAVSSYLEHAAGKASLNILKMAKPEFAFELRTALNLAIQSNKSVTKSDIEIKIDSVLRLMSFTVNPLQNEGEEPLFLIVFQPNERVEKIFNLDSPGNENNNSKDLKIKKLTEELLATRAEMIKQIESQESIYEELQAANEEIVSSNEEFQTLNEELETSKEEIEATNEELICTNQELQTRHGQLIESYEYSEAIIATIHEPMLVLNNSFKIISANKSFYKTFLVEKKDTEGKLLFELGNKQWNIKKLRDVLNEIIDNNIGFDNFEVTQTFSGIGEKIMLLNAHLIVQKSSCEQLILLAIEDITDRSRFYIKEKFAMSLIEASLDPLTTINNEGVITNVNQAMINDIGLSREKLIGSTYFDYFSKPEHARLAYQEVLSNGYVNNAPSQLKKQHGEIIDVLLNGSVYKDDKGIIQGLVFVARDISDQKRIQSELKKAKVIAEKATKIAEKAKKAAEQATVIAENATMAKQQFLSNMSHEIRTPMNAIIGFTAVLLRSKLSQQQLVYLDAIKVSGDTLIALINDILDLAKVDAGKMVFERKLFKIENLLFSILKLFITKIEDKKLKIVVNYDKNIPSTVSGDSMRLNQIMLNLMSNAIKFTDKGSISINTFLLFEDDKKVIVEFVVTDTGIGIPIENIDLIFENFHQATNQSAGIHGGTGLGLAIVKQLIEAQGGSIRVNSKVGEGTSFRFNLPFEKTCSTIDIETNIEVLNTDLKKIKVLIVEDDALNQLLMKTILNDLGFERDVANNGQIAIDLLKKKTYDIILMDVHMPVMNGFETSIYIREVMKLNTPIIALTADVTSVDKDKCHKVGINDYVAKPLDVQLLLKKIKKLT